MCCLSESSSTCPCPAYVTFQERVTQCFLAIVGNHCWGRCAQSEAHCITVSLKYRLPILHQHFKKLFFSSWKPFLSLPQLGGQIYPCCNSTKANLAPVFPYLSAKDPIKRDPDESRSKGSYFLTKCSPWAISFMWTAIFCQPMGSWWQTHLMCLLSQKTSLFQQEISGPTFPRYCS